MVVGHTIANGLAKIVQKAVGFVAVVHNSPGQHRHEFSDVVSAVFLKIRRKVFCPAYQSHFPTVGLQEMNTFPNGLCRFDERNDDGIGEQIESFRVQVIDRQTFPSVAAGRGACTGAGIAISDNRPITSGCIPFELSIPEVCSQIDDFIFADGHHFAVSIVILAQLIKRINAFPANFFVERFYFPVFNGFILYRSAFFFRDGLNANILIIQIL